MALPGPFLDSIPANELDNLSNKRLFCESFTMLLGTILRLIRIFLDQFAISDDPTGILQAHLLFLLKFAAFLRILLGVLYDRIETLKETCSGCSHFHLGLIFFPALSLHHLRNLFRGL